MSELQPTAEPLTDARAPLLAHDLRRLRAVSAVLLHGSASAASKALHVTQSSITRAVRDVERQLGFPLFERASRGMVGTPAGRLLGVRLTHAWDELERAAADAVALSPPIESRSGHSSGRLASLISSRGLQSLIAVAALESEPRVAAHIGVSQPAVHRQLLQVERLAGTRLFLRTTRGTQLTEPGAAIVRGAKLALAEIRMAEEELSAFGGHLRGRVAVGALPLSSALLVPAAVTRTAKQHADLRITVVDGTYDSLVQQMRDGDVDMIVGALRPQPTGSDISQAALFEDTLSVIVRTDHPCRAGRRKPPRSLADLMDQPWVVPLPDTPARHAFERAFHAEGLALPRLNLQANSPAIVRALLLDGDWLALLSPHQVRVETQRGLLTVLAVPVQGTARTIGIATRKAGRPSPGALALLDQLRHVAAEIAGADASR